MKWNHRWALPRATNRCFPNDAECHDNSPLFQEDVGVSFRFGSVKKSAEDLFEQADGLTKAGFEIAITRVVDAFKGDHTFILIGA